MSTTPRVVIGLSAVIVAATEDAPYVVVTRDGDLAGLPFGPFDPAGDRTLELSLRGWVKQQTGFDIGYVMRPDGIPQGQSWTSNPLDPKLPIARIWDDNGKARGYGFQARLLGDQWRGVDGKGLPEDLPDLTVGPWDPDPHWQRVLELTEVDRLDEALALVEAIPGRDREPMFDEVIYLRFLTKTPLQAQDIRVLARKHVENSLIAGRLLEEFDAFLKHLDAQFALEPPVLEEMTRLRPDFGS